MNFLLHNRIEISNGSEKAYFYNNMLPSVISQLQLKKSYNDYIAVGTGNDSAESATTYKLKSHLKTYKLETEFLQDDVTKETLYIKKTAVIDDSFLDNKLLLEAGITDTLESNPTIFNYFQFVDNNQLTGISKQRGVPLVISIYIYLSLSKSPNYLGLLTSGNNKFIDFLLGNGLDDEIYCARGSLFADNSNSIFRENYTGIKYPCEMNITTIQGGVEITFVGDMGTGLACEVLMLVGNSPFARILTISSSDVSTVNEDFAVKSNKVVEVDDNVNEIVSVINNSTTSAETLYCSKKSAISFGDKIALPFNNMFDDNMARFISKDGDKLFFVIDDKIYGYKSANFSVLTLDTSTISLQNIINIVAFGNYLFVITKNSPYIYAYILENNVYSNCEVDLTNFDKSSIISNIFKCDFCLSNSGKIMFGVIDREDYYGWTFYFDYDSNTNKIVYDNYVCSSFAFNYILAMQKTEFNDAMTIFLKSNELAHLCKIVYHYPDKTYQDIYSTLAYYLTYDTKEIYTCGRAIIVEQLSSPKIWIYLYPDITKIDLDISGDEVDDYISTNLKYLFQRHDDGSFKFYNLVGYDTPTEFVNNLPAEIDASKILDFVFLNDILLIFLNDEKQKIVGINLLENKTYIENVSSNTDTYNITYKKYNIIGGNNDNVIANFMIRIVV